MYTYAQAVGTGGLLYYGDSASARYRRVAHFLDRVLRGGDPTTMPVEEPFDYELVVNLGAARAIDLELSPAFLVQATRVLD